MTPAPDRRDFQTLKVLGLYAQRTLELPQNLSACVDHLQHIPRKPMLWYESELVSQTDAGCEMIVRWLLLSRGRVIREAIIFCTLTAADGQTRVKLQAYPGTEARTWVIFALFFLPADVAFGYYTWQMVFNGALAIPGMFCFWGLILIIAMLTPICVYFIATQHRDALKGLLDYLQKPETYAEAKR